MVLWTLGSAWSMSGHFKLPNPDSYRDLTGAGGTACVPVALAEVESGTTGMSSSSNFTNVPRRTIPARSRASQFVSRMQPWDWVLLMFLGSGVPWMP